MAKRYSGDLQINVVYDDRGDYRTSVSRGGKVRWRGRINPAPAGFGRGVAYDSAKAYDEIAESALAFADDDVRGLGESAEMDDQGYKIRRVPRYWEQYPGGRIAPKRFARRDVRRDPTERAFPIGARVLVDGRDEAIVRQVFPKGSTSYLFPHYKLDIIRGDKNVAVSMKRVGVRRR